MHSDQRGVAKLYIALIIVVVVLLGFGLYKYATRDSGTNAVESSEVTSEPEQQSSSGVEQTSADDTQPEGNNSQSDNQLSSDDDEVTDAELEAGDIYPDDDIE